MNDTTRTMGSKWREAVLWAIVAAVGLEFVINLVNRKTLWQRIDFLEQRVSHLERIHEAQDKK